MVFRVPPGERGTDAGHVDYRLARASMIRQYENGELSPSEVCDAHPELIRAAGAVGAPTPGACPICEREDLVHVTYVFGPRLPSHGRCISLRGELARLARRPGRHTAYVVEVCRGCNWNHLVRRSDLTAEPPPNDGTEGPPASANAEST